jgi:hypothetical protein
MSRAAAAIAKLGTLSWWPAGDDGTKPLLLALLPLVLLANGRRAAASERALRHTSWLMSTPQRRIQRSEAAAGDTEGGGAVDGGRERVAVWCMLVLLSSCHGNEAGCH